MDDDTRTRKLRLQREATARYMARKRGEDVPLRPSGARPRPLRERFEARVIRSADECWEWSGAHDPAGYPRLGIGRDGKRTTLGAHRLAYELFVGVIPDGFVIDHLCRNPGCVNPEHLEAVTQTVNFLRGVHRSAITARENRCQRGHEFTPENTIILKRACRTCMKANIQARRGISPPR